MKKIVLIFLAICAIVFNVYAQNDIINGYSYVDLGLSVKWATRNLGYSSHYSWGENDRKATYHRNNCHTCDKRMSDISGNASYDAARANWGGSWRIPTKAEMEELVTKCTWTWTTQRVWNNESGRSEETAGYKVTGPNGNSIFLPVTDGSVNASSLDFADKDAHGYYWTSTPHFCSDGTAYILIFNSSGYSVYSHQRHFGLAIRPVSD